MSAAAPFLVAFDRHLRRRRLAAALEGARRGGRRALLVALALIAFAVLGVLPPPGGPVAAVAALAALLLAGAAAGSVAALRREGGAGTVAAALDRALGEQDLVSTAAALCERGRSPGRFAAAVLDRAAGEVRALPLEKAGPLPRPPWKTLGLAALVAFLLSILPQGGFGLLPGLGRGWGTGGRPGSKGPTWGRPKEGPGGSATLPAGESRRPPEARPPERKAPERPPEPPRPPEERTVATLKVEPLARAYPPVGPLAVAVTADGGPGAGAGTDLDLRMAVDGGPAAPAGTPLRLAAGSHEALAPDLRTWPGLLGTLGPGKHRLAGELRDPAGRVVARAPEIEITVEGGGEESPKGGGKPPPAPKPPSAREAPPPRPQPSPPSSSPGAAAGGRPPPAPTLPPSAFQRQLVLPLFGEGAEVEKEGPILVLDPEGARGDRPREVSLPEAVDEVRARAEAAARREGLDPRDLETVRRYFEALRRIVEGGK